MGVLSTHERINMLLDLRFAVGLRKKAAFRLMAIPTFALGIGRTSTVLRFDPRRTLTPLPDKAGSHYPAVSGLLTLEIERQRAAAQPLRPKAMDQSFGLRLEGNMAKYEWPNNGVGFDVANPRSAKAAVRDEN